ncbi:MAG: hypothetical protein AUJ12_09020 [Alphaproteobacteria bacterium CG1_02_46_17]|nr:MAG: hypothetical protein AUJ12_09020 [Alphaproteobacteria bacterium CG1_02_46_17]
MGLLLKGNIVEILLLCQVYFNIIFSFVENQHKKLPEGLYKERRHSCAVGIREFVSGRVLDSRQGANNPMGTDV